MLVLGLMLLLGDVVLGTPAVVSRRVESVPGISGLVELGVVVVGLVLVGLVLVGLVLVGLVVVARGRAGAVVGMSLVTRPPPMTSPPALPLVRGARVVSRVAGC
jgi:hypothetical protein